MLFWKNKWVYVNKKKFYQNVFYELTFGFCLMDQTFSCDSQLVYVQSLPMREHDKFSSF